jgi:hypothetical protein
MGTKAKSIVLKSDFPDKSSFGQTHPLLAVLIKGVTTEFTNKLDSPSFISLVILLRKIDALITFLGIRTQFLLDIGHDNTHRVALVTFWEIQQYTKLFLRTLVTSFIFSNSL